MVAQVLDGMFFADTLNLLATKDNHHKVHDFPENAKFLSEPDRIRVIRRLMLDNQSSAEHEMFKMEYVAAALKDWKTWTACIIYMGCGGALYAFALFLPTIIADLGYVSTTAQLLTVPVSWEKYPYSPMLIYHSI
jgi:hypothetical protein